jgi:hypothetical protein
MNKVRESLRQYGAWATVKLVGRNVIYELRWWVDRRFDKRFRVQTSGRIPLAELAFDSPVKAQGIRYESTAARIVRAMLGYLPTDLRDFTFVDFGSGMGRVLLLAAEHNFRQIIGIEFAPHLHDVALMNLKSYRNPRQACFALSAYCMDAAAFSIPDGPLVLSFFDPFREEVMRKVLSNLAASHHQSPRKMFLLYYCPVHRDLIEALGFFHRVKTRPLPWAIAGAPRQYGFVMYESGE